MLWWPTNIFWRAVNSHPIFHWNKLIFSFFLDCILRLQWANCGANERWSTQRPVSSQLPLLCWILNKSFPGIWTHQKIIFLDRYFIFLPKFYDLCLVTFLLTMQIYFWSLVTISSFLGLILPTKISDTNFVGGKIWKNRAHFFGAASWPDFWK